MPTDRAELMLEALAGLVETMEVVDEADTPRKPHQKAPKRTPRGVLAGRPPVQIHVHEDAKTGRMTLQTDAGERELSRAES